MKQCIAATLSVFALALSAVGASAAYVEQIPRYTPTHYPYVEPKLGDGSTPSGGTPPAFANEPANVPSNFNVTNWMVTTVPQGSSTGAEAKFRTHCNYSHHLRDDPIVYPGRPGWAHLHTFFGNTRADANSNYKSLRSTGGSTCGGGPLNRSAYWYPSVLKRDAIGDGETMVVKPDHAVIYYTIDDRDVAKLTRIPRGLRYVFGFNPADPANDKIKAEIRRANRTGSGQLFASYMMPENGFVGWRCEISNGSTANSPVKGSATQPYLRNANGTPTLNCPLNERIAAMITAPQCWDGVNFTSPDGRSHVRYMIRERNSGKLVCPIGWYRLAVFDLFVWFSHKGPEDYSNWFLSSDRVPGHERFLNGQTFHADWFGAWDYDVMQTWMVNCNGTTIGARTGRPHSCVDTAFGDGTGGIVQGAAPNGTRNPQVDLGTRWATRGNRRFDPLPPAR